MQKIQNALVYPIFILVVFAGVMTLMFVFVIPRISKVFDKLRIDMPLPTKILVFSSHIVINYYPILIAGILGAVAIIIYLYRTKKREFLVFFSTPSPLLHRLAIEVDIARVCRNTGLMLSSGVPLLALDLAEGIIVQQSVRAVFKTVIHKVSEGKLYQTA